MASDPAAYLHFGEFDSYGKLDFDKKAIRKGMRLVGALVRREARALVNQRGTRSAGGEYPTRDEGLLYRSIRAKVSRPGFLVKIAPQKIAGMKDFYPAYLHYGVKQGGRLKAVPQIAIGKKSRRKKGERAAALAARAAGAWSLEPRKNFMADALESSSGRVQQILRQAFADALS